MNRSSEDSDLAQKRKPWIRRHRILALFVTPRDIEDVPTRDAVNRDRQVPLS